MSGDRQNEQGDQAFRADSLYGRAPEMTYGGALSFLRRRYTRAIDGADLVVSGMPFDLATTNRPGSRFGPQAIRAASTQLAELDAFPWNFDPFDHLAVADWGDCHLPPGDPQQMEASMLAHARAILATGAQMLTLGGDHYIAWPLLRAHAERYGPLSLIQFDAHPDTWDNTGGPLDHGTLIARAVREGVVDPARSIQIGIRTQGPDYGFAVVDAPWVHEHGRAAVLDRVRAVVGDRPAYLTFDIDCLDPAFAPGTGTPVAGGLSSAQALAILRGTGDVSVVGMDVVEVAPAYDHSQITALAAATLAHEHLCVRADAKRRGRESR